MARKLYNTVDKEILKKKLEQSDEKRITLSFYRYANIGNINIFRDHFYDALDKLGILGRIYVAHEGINAQISVPEDQMKAFKEFLSTITFLEKVRLNYAIEDDGKSFFKLIIRIKEKIVADGLDDLSFNVLESGEHLDAVTFNEITEKPDTIVVDMRNHYESEVGHFKNAICPDVETFREALPKVAKELEEEKDKTIVMYCTGGIRCEKASAYMRHKGFKNVFQLDGGIIEYARQVEKKGLKNKFLGKNFVFDDRLGERISKEIIAKCYQCGNPCDNHINCANNACHRLVIQCDVCAEKYQNCCSDPCHKYFQLPEEVQQELRKGIKLPSRGFRKSRTSPFLENKAILKKVEALFAKL